MREVIVLPDIGEGVVEGEVVRWIKESGDTVKQDEPVVVVMTDKATVELPSPFSGVITNCFVPVGEKAERGKPLYEVETEEKEPLATPYVRALAKEKGIDLRSVKSSEGHVREEDLLLYQKEEVRPQVGIRQKISEKMTESKQTIPSFSFFDRLNATKLMEKRGELKERFKTLTFMPFIIYALSSTIKKYPELNSALFGKDLHLYQEQKIAIAIESKDGLIAPHLSSVEKMSFLEIVEAYEALIRKAKEGRLTPKELSGSTITISNFGVFGGRWATPIINPPEVAILAVAKIADEAVAVAKEVKVLPMMNLSWSFDHRVIDGALAAKASSQFIHYLENLSEIL